MIKKIKNFITPAFIILIAVFVGFAIAKAENSKDIIFPVAELGNCQDETECRTYCDREENISPCVDFSEKHNLMSEEEISKARAFANSKNRPGDCKNEKECESYCENIKNIDSCLSFAEENGFIGEKELKEARQVSKALKEGTNLPGGCGNKKECEAYCENTDHIDECVSFAEKAGFMSGSELEDAKKAAKAISSGVKPPGSCRGKEQCDMYCSDSSHMEECLNFAEAAGFMPKEEAEMARKIMPMMMKGEMPGGCKSKEQCENYCEDSERSEECANFAVKAGFMNQEEYDMFKKTGGKGPGGCKGKDECENFCENPDNQEACFNFGKEHNLIPEEKLKEMREGVEKIKDAFKTAPPEVTDCIKSKVGTENFDKMQSGESMPNPKIGEQIRACFEEIMPKMQKEGMGGMMEGKREMPAEINEEIRGRIKEKMMKNNDSGSVGGMEGVGMDREEIEKNIRGKIEQETRQKIEEEIKQKMMGEFNKTE